ncbi:FAD-dependent oxidoreductase [Candidatus Kirkpatrickella diaphorinae]|uniref:FAD-dependent oxidoreductase n=1 Tax=Candidatus Kirkpatrickella diaphorinae TaxID=2984322 RepID=A0ABY6GI22_9PROT|nr:FAD-dependent oxidoreductase [Candidatus Kirkpatrickella diaphorinae]UYH50706.1 FAD-dependent oxidoreductase [Candidatus Kirkpatrickella diaphorinae]
MIRVTEIRLPLAHGEDAIRKTVAARLGVDEQDVRDIKIARRGYDARHKHRIMLVYHIDCSVDHESEILQKCQEDARAAMRVMPTPAHQYNVPSAPHPPQRPVVIGAGPCGLMAALVLAKAGLRPLIIERGKKVRERTVDTFAFWRKAELTPESNVQFGEGGAGTFSDGKLYSGVSDPRHLGRFVLETFVKAGAPAEILYLSKPHIGTFRLVTMVENLRAEIERLGGNYQFNSRVDGIRVDAQQRLTGLDLADGSHIPTRHAVFALGHSARDSFDMLHAAGLAMHAKPFSIGVRIEHPQSVIDAARFGPSAGHHLLGAADYKLVHRASNGRSVYSFCMCPGGTVVAATSERGAVATNGMSQYSRAERNANAGIVVEVKPDIDFPNDVLGGIAFQRRWEQAAFNAGGRNYAAPAQKVGDFLAGRASTDLGAVIPSYKPGVTPADLRDCLPDFAIDAIREALPVFDAKIPGFSMDDAVLTGVETRTSSPLRLDRDKTGQSPSIRGVFPAGEGAGYAGGILSAGIDGIRAAEFLAAALREETPIS